jgi:hypothetical protein
MIKQLASPSVCVIDDEEEEYRPILAALNEMFVSCVHILGNSLEGLPPQPFKRVQLTFVDLHLSGTVGKDAASHTANVFTKVMSPDTAPIVVVIWSKYAKDLVAQDGVPPEDQDTEAELFKKTLLVLLHHKSLWRVFLAMGTAQHGHRDKVLTSATIRYRCMVATEFGLWRSGRKGGASGSVTVGNGKFLEERGGGRS